MDAVIKVKCVPVIALALFLQVNAAPLVGNSHSQELDENSTDSELIRALVDGLINTNDSSTPSRDTSHQVPVRCVFPSPTTSDLVLIRCVKMLTPPA